MLSTRKVLIILLALALVVLLAPKPEDPGDNYGMALGILGTALMVVMHSYTLRKKKYIKSGKVPDWLSFHMALGLIGPAIILVHSRMVMAGIAGFAAFLMLAEAISGIMGRYIYMKIPRTKRGRTKDLEEIKEEEQQLSEEIKRIEDDPEIRNLIEAEPDEPGNIFVLLFKDIIDALKWKYHILRSKGAKRQKLKQAERLAHARTKTRRSIAALNHFQALMENWRTAHIPVASVFYLLVAIHIVSIYYY